MARICLIDNMAALYRKGIYLLMDKEWDMDWYFGESESGIKTLDVSILKNVHMLKTIRRNHIPGYWLKNMSASLKGHDIIIMIGEPALWSTWGLLLKNKFSFHRKKVYFWTHGWYGKETLFRKIIKKIYFKLGTGVITYGDYARNLMIKEGFDPEKVIAIHNSLDYDVQLKLRNTISSSDVYFSQFCNNCPNLVFIGRLAKYKKLHLLIEAIKKLKEQGLNFNLTVIGDGECEEELRLQVHKFGLDKDVWFYGACYDEKTNAELIYNADLCVSPGNVGLNAVHTLMFGTPVATHNSFPYQGPEFEVVHEGSTGSFFKQDDSVDMARCISEWFTKHGNNRDEIRNACFEEIDTNWTPQFQMEVLKKIISVQ